MSEKVCRSKCPNCGYSENASPHFSEIYMSDDEQVHPYACEACGQEYEEHYKVTVEYETTFWEEGDRVS